MSKKKNKNRKHNESVNTEAVVEEAAEETVEDTAVETSEDTAEKAVEASEEPAEEVAEEAAEDTEEETAEKAADEKPETAEKTAEAAEDTAEETSKDTAEETVEDAAEETVEETAEEVPEEKAETVKPVISAKEELAKAQKSALKSHKERTEENVKAKENDARREARHKKRIRNQVISYVAVFLFLAVVLGGGYAIFRYISSKFAKPSDVQQVEETAQPTDEQIEEQIEAIIGEEEEIVPPEIDEDQIIADDVTAEPEVDPLDEYIDGIISQMSLEDKVAGVIMTSPEALTGVDHATLAGNGTKTALETYKVGGLVYDPSNVTAHDQFSDMISGTLEMVQTPTFFAFPDVGGADSILAKDGFYDAVTNPADTAATGEVINAYNNGETIGKALKEIGINVALAPIADISITDGNIIGNKAYGSDPYMVAEYVKSMISGLEASGVTACIKYFPGLGSVTADPAKERAVSDRTETEYRSGEFPVYISAIEGGVKMIMVGNVVVTAFDDSCPASLSEKIVTDLLRDEFEYKGVIISGNLSDAAVKDYYGAGEAAVLTLKAGCDMVQNPDDFEEAFNAIIDAVNSGVISEERIDDCLRRIYRIKYADAV